MRKEGDMIIREEAESRGLDAWLLFFLLLPFLLFVYLKSLEAGGAAHFILFFISYYVLYLITDPELTDIERDEAIAAVKSEPADPVAWLVLAHILDAEGEKAEARHCYERALSITLPSVITTLQPQTHSLLPSMAMTGTEANLTLNELSKKTTLAASRPQLVRLSRMTKLPILLVLVLAWGKYFPLLALLVQLLEYLFIPLLIAIGLWFILQIFLLLKIAMASTDWLPTKALIIGSYVKLYKGRKGQKSYHFYMASLYQIKDKHYISLLPSVDVYGDQQVWFNSGQYASASSESALRKLQNDYADGKVLTVYYDPQKPELVTDKQGTQVETSLFSFALLAIFCWLLAVVIAIYG